MILPTIMVIIQTPTSNNNKKLITVIMMNLYLMTKKTIKNGLVPKENIDKEDWGEEKNLKLLKKKKLELQNVKNMHKELKCKIQGRFTYQRFRINKK